MNNIKIFQYPRFFSAFIYVLITLTLVPFAVRAETFPDFKLGAGDAIKIQVFQNPDLNVEARVSETGVISYPMLGSIKLGDLSIEDAEKKIAESLRAGGFVKQPQVNIVILQVRGSQVSVLGQVNKPGQFPLEVSGMRVTDLIAKAGGVTATGDDIAVVTGMRNGMRFRKEIDIPVLFAGNNELDNIAVTGGDSIFVPRAPVFYIYGEAQKPGVYRVERAMTVMQALATGGGPTSRGSQSRLRLHRKNGNGIVEETNPKASEQIRGDDVIYVRESLF